MNKKILIGTLTAGLALGGALSVGAVGSGNTHVSNATAEGKMISSNKAKEIALHKVSGKVESINLENKGNHSYYEVDIAKNNIGYELVIDPVKGKIQSVHNDENNRKDHESVDKKYNNTLKNQSTISQNEATTIARKTVNGDVTKVEKENDDGIQKYEIEMKTPKNKADVEINAMTGKVLKVDHDNDHDDDHDNDHDNDIED
ncbi:PepSY domain-containing protein [Bacillus sp. FJAT-29790]|uniref:PepSY domain-containing protein n=1 Tax=Bacillus sp. FJAT-29790 TaxID=1895002 RepID=UPI001C24105D|nr:PepSY domain-containing protein [Bacillus sp. FJAT-29790]MBU8878829.1 PepSY domain-containing protein [Bacillus sp. FJAT-29790]